MISVTWQIRIERAAEDVFDFVADLRNEPKFNPDATDIQRLTPDPIGQGTVYTETMKVVGQYCTTIDRYERPTRLGFDARNPKADASVQFTFTPAAESSTDVSCTVELRMKGALRLMEKAMAPTIRKQIEHSRGPMLKQALESEAQTPAPS